jgi:hypothetical protein
LVADEFWTSPLILPYRQLGKVTGLATQADHIAPAKLQYLNGI